ncbi:hypothetical protein ACM66B_001634 [Microbotryomycetes sp. NB124-2]
MVQTVLILGGLGQDGSRHLLSHLLGAGTSTAGAQQRTTQAPNTSKPAFVRVVDKFLIIPQADPMPSTVYLDDRTKNAIKSSRAEYMQGNLLTEATRQRAFSLPEKYGGPAKGFDAVFDFTGESDFELTDGVHVERTLKLALALGQTAKDSKVGIYVRVLPCQYKTSRSRVGAEESGAIEPWGVRAQWHQEAARGLAKIDNLNLVCLRPAYFYGPATLTGLTPRALIGELYKFRHEKLEFLWKDSLAVNTIHAHDFCTAATAVVEWALKRDPRALLDMAGEKLTSTLNQDKLIKDVSGAAKSTEQVTAPVFEIVDDCETEQRQIAKLISQVIGVECGFHNSIISSFAKLNMEDVLEDVNEKHMQGWSDLLTASDPPISSTTPLSPYTPVDLLQPYPVAFSNRKLKAIGWMPSHRLDAETLRETIDGFKAEGIWPRVEAK